MLSPQESIVANCNRARTTRAGLMEKRAASIGEMQKADQEISRREAEAAKACTG